jgi:hypothetical protein
MTNGKHTVLKATASVYTFVMMSPFCMICVAGHPCVFKLTPWYLLQETLVTHQPPLDGLGVKSVSQRR